MKEFPGCITYEPADVGFNNATIPAANNVNGNILPVLGKRKIFSCSVIFKSNNDATPYDLQANIIDSDGATVLSLGNSLITAIGSATVWFACHGTGTVGFVGGGTLTTNVAPVTLLNAPFMQLRVSNQDAVNALTGVYIYVRLAG